MTYAQTADVQARLGRTLTTEETALVAVRLADAERMIIRRIPELAGQTEAGQIDVEDVKQVEAEAVLRLVRNPDGYASETDGNYSREFARDITSGKLEILPDEWRTLGVVVPRMVVLAPSFPNSPVYVPFSAGG